MNEKELLKLVAPMWKQYLRCIVGCFCAYLSFKFTLKFLIFFFIIASVISFRSMLEVTLWQRKISKGDYEILKVRVTGVVLNFVLVDDNGESGVGFNYVDGLEDGDVVKAVKVNEDYLIIEKVDK